MSIIEPAYDYALRVVARLRELGAPVAGSFSWSPERIVIDMWNPNGSVGHFGIDFAPGTDFSTLPLPGDPLPGEAEAREPRQLQ